MFMYVFLFILGDVFKFYLFCLSILFFFSFLRLRMWFLMLRKVRFFLEGNIFVREVCVGLFCLLIVELEDNEDCLID